MAGARRPGHPGIPIALADGQSVTDVAIRMPRGAAISGVVVDERGRPASGVAIGVLPARFEDGRRVLNSMPGLLQIESMEQVRSMDRMLITDKFGRYRVHGLAPGSYAIVAMSLRGSRFATPELTDSQVDAVMRGEPAPPPTSLAASASTMTSPVPVYFPGTTRQADAQLLTIAAGEDRRQVDFQIQSGRAARVEGTVIAGDGQPLPNVRVSLRNESSSPLQTERSATVVDGRFAIAIVPPGSYTLEARTTAGNSLVGSTSLEVDGVDQAGVQLILRPPMTLTGRVVIEGGRPAAALTGRTVTLVSLAGGERTTARSVDSKGTFAIPDVLPGRYRVGPPLFGSGAGMTMGLQSVVVDGTEITDLPLTVSTETAPKEIVLTFGERWQELSGRLMDAAGKGVSDYTVMIFPVNDAYWLYGSRRIVTSEPATDGRFTIGGPGAALLPAGEYYLAAVTDVSKDEQYDPAFLQTIIPAAIKVTLAPGARQMQDLRVR
jgi:protocatechuate 3,4-dioxygenase beta subunit